MDESGNKVLAVIMGGGRGTRLFPLTQQRCKPAVPLAGVVTSPLERCRQTAKAIVTAHPGAPRLTTERGITECDYGDWAGRPIRELAKEKLWSLVQTQPSAAVFPHGEAMTAMQARAVAAVRRPFVVLTSNASRELSEAVKRRCLFLHLDYPDADREREVVTSHVPEAAERLTRQLVDLVSTLRELDLKKAPSISESVDWARTLVALEVGDLDEDAVERTLGVVLKHSSDQDKAVAALRGHRSGGRPTARRR